MEGEMSKGELLRLMDLMSDQGLSLTSLEAEKLRELKLKHGLISQEESDRGLIESLRVKLNSEEEELTKAEVT